MPGSEPTSAETITILLIRNISNHRISIFVDPASDSSTGSEGSFISLVSGQSIELEEDQVQLGQIDLLRNNKVIDVFEYQRQVGGTE